MMAMLERLLATPSIVLLHVASALAALALGALMLARRKGTPSHRTFGWLWVLLMACATASSALIRDSGLPNIAGFTPIHLLTAFVAVTLPRAVWFARSGQIERHRKAMRGLYIGGCVVAGAFALAPGRALGTLLLELFH